MKGTIDIGVLFPLTGPKATSGGATVNAFPVAFEIAKARGLGDGVELRFHNGDASDEESGAREAERLIKEVGCQVLMGALISSHSLAFTEVANEHGVFYWEVVAAAAEITQRGFPHLFRQSSAAHQYGQHFAQFVGDSLLPRTGGKPQDTTIAVLTESTAFGRSVGDSVVAESAGRGIRTVARVEHHPEEQDLTAQVEEIKAAGPDFIFSASLGPVVPRIWSTLEELNVPLQGLIGTGSWGLPKYTAYPFGKRIDGVYCLDSPHLATLSAENFEPGAKETFDLWMKMSPVKHSAESIVDPDLAVMAVMAFVEEILPRVESLDTSELSAAAREIDVPRGGTVVGYGIKFDQIGDNERSFRTVVQWQDGGDLKTVYPEFMAVTEPKVDQLR